MLREVGKGNAEVLLQVRVAARSAATAAVAGCLAPCIHTLQAALASDSHPCHQSVPYCGCCSLLPQFVESNLAHFSAEGLRYALEHQSPAVRKRLTAQHKEQLAAAAASAAAAGVQHPEGGLAAAECDAAPAKRRRRG